MQESDMGAIVWLAAYPRSGNTWTRVFLHNLLSLVEGRPLPRLDQLDEYSTWDIAAHWYEPFVGPRPDHVTKEAVAAARPEAQRRIAESVDGIIFVKTHAALVRDRGTPTIDMTRTAGAVYLVRNPLDVVLSYAAHMDIPIEEAASIINTPRFETANGPGSVYEFYGSWSQHVQSWTRKPHPAICVIRYEDMVTDPVAVFVDLAKHLRIDASHKDIETACELSAFDRLAAIEAKDGFRERPTQSARFFRSGRVGQWRDQLAPHLIDALVAANGETMQRYSYLP
jgi:hypothetical protein